MRSTITEPGVAVKDQSIIIVRKRHASGVYRRMLALYKKNYTKPWRPSDIKHSGSYVRTICKIRQ